MTDWDGEESEFVKSIAALERLKAAAAARQARLAAALDATRRAAEAAAGMPVARRGRGVAAEVALARRDSPARGSRHLGFAKALVNEMPYTLAALEVGALSEWRATIVVRESACLDVEDRRRLDAELWMRLLYHGYHGVLVPEALHNYRCHGPSRNSLDARQKEHLRWRMILTYPGLFWRKLLKHPFKSLYLHHKLGELRKRHGPAVVRREGE